MKAILQMILIAGLCSGYWTDEGLKAQVMASREMLPASLKQGVVQTQSLKMAIAELESRYQVVFFYDTQLIRSIMVSQPPASGSLEKVLTKLLAPVNLSFKNIKGNTYVIFPPAGHKNQPLAPGNPAPGSSGATQSDGPSQVHSLESTEADVAVFNVTGRVTDDQGSGLPGVSVILKGTTTGTATDSEGKYSLSVPDGNGTLIFSFIGFVSEEVAISNRNAIDVVLVPDIKSLNEVVVVGYGSVQKRELTSAVTSVSSKDFVAGSFNNPMQMIEGRVPGLVISNTAASDPNAQISLQVRGASSLDAGNAPLVVIDGMPGGDLRTLAQQDIESISVLRDAAASSIYGSRGANGVILVQTKRGKAGRVSVTYDSFFDHDVVAKKPDVLSTDEFLARGIDVDRGARTNWYDELIRKNNFGQNHLLSVSGGTENTNFRISGNYRNKSAIDIASQRQEYGLRSSFQQKAIKGLLQLDGNFTYRVVGEEYTNYGAFLQAIKLNPTLPLMDPANPTRYNTLAGFDTYNPVQDLKTRENGADLTYAVVDVTARLNLLKNLNTELKVGRQGVNKLGRFYSTSQSAGSVQSGRNGLARLNNEEWTSYILEWISNYNTTIDRHSFNVMGGYSYQQIGARGFNAENETFPTDAFKYNNLDAGERQNELGRLGMDSYRWQEKVIAFLGRVNYSYNDTYFLTASARYEGNTKFGVNNKWGLFPAASVAWRISNLPFLASSGAINDMKLRASWGVTGRSGFPTYTSLAKYQGYGKYQNDEGQWVRVYGPGNNYNPNLRWERAISYNLGIDFALFESRLSGSIDAFIRKNSDLISNYQVSVPPFLHETMFVNVGTSSARGIEMSLSFQAINKTDFGYTTSFTGSYAKARLDSWSNAQFRSTPRNLRSLPSPGNPGEAIRTGDGDELGRFYGYKYAGVDENGNIMIWKNGQEGGERINATNEADRDRDRTYIGNGTPRYQIAWSNSLRFKSLDLSFLFQGRFDYQILNLYQMYYGLQAEQKINLLRDAFGRNGHIKSNKVITDYFLESGDYFRLENITLGWSPKLPIKELASFRIYGAVRNVFTLTKYTGLDPTAVNVTGLEPGIGNLDVYPVTRTFTLGAQITF